jgi:NADPH:quinone reductase
VGAYEALNAGAGESLTGAITGPPPPFRLDRRSGITAGPDSGTRPDNGSLAVQWVSASHYLHDPVDRAAAAQAVMTDTLQGRLTPRIVDRFRLQDAAKAHERLADRTVTGKLLLHP